MDIFKNKFGKKIDLDDRGNVNIYPPRLFLIVSVQELFDICKMEAGRSLLYMHYLHPTSVFINSNQHKRIDSLIKKLVGEDGRKRYTENKNTKDYEEIIKDRVFLLKWLYKFTDEIENQC